MTACVVTWATARTARVPALAGIPVRVGQARRFYSFRFTKRVVVRSEGGDVTSHWSRDSARLRARDRLRHRGPPLSFRSDGRKTSARPSSSARRPQRFVILNPCNAIASRAACGRSTDGRRSPARCAKEYGARIVVAARRPTRRWPTASRVLAGDDAIVSIAGQTSVGGVRRARAQRAAFVGITTGSMHVAAAVGCSDRRHLSVSIRLSRALGAARASGRRSCARRIRATEAIRRRRCRDYACIASLDVPRILPRGRRSLVA